MNNNSIKRPVRCIHWRDAMTLLESGIPVDLKVWKLSSGDIIEYKQAVCTGFHWRKGIHRIICLSSRLPRAFRDITLFEINGHEIIR